MGSEEEKANSLEGLKSAAGFIRREIGRRVQLRYTPEIHLNLTIPLRGSLYYKAD